MSAVEVTVLRAGWWLPGRVLAPGETLALDAATAAALARRGIVRIAVAEHAGHQDGAPARKRRSRRKKTEKTEG
ncbi:MAG: hypothetical protein KatS3mg124_1833 [Porticoccaceae bacterium]|nr:MAG: hypothetical protein KatS3mg124_1833 [Porticoccaceae bacterium]